MDTLFTNKTIQTKKTQYQTMLKFALFAAALLFTANAFASRPAMEDRPAMEKNSQHSNNVSSKAMEPTGQPTSSTRPEPLKSSVEIMMQRQQIYQTGDVVQLPAKGLPAKELQPGETLKIKLLDFPRRGMSMGRVEFAYGQPVAISTSVGQPPITRWTYDDRVVYFEYSTVIHVVAR